MGICRLRATHLSRLTLHHHLVSTRPSTARRIFWIFGPFCLAMGGVIISTCPLDVIDLDKGSKKDPVLKFVLSGVSRDTRCSGCSCCPGSPRSASSESPPWRPPPPHRSVSTNNIQLVLYKVQHEANKHGYKVKVYLLHQVRA